MWAEHSQEPAAGGHEPTEGQHLGEAEKPEQSRAGASGGNEKCADSLAKAPETCQRFIEFEHKEKHSKMEAFHHMCFICHFIYFPLRI